MCPFVVEGHELVVGSDRSAWSGNCGGGMLYILGLVSDVVGWDSGMGVALNDSSMSVTQSNNIDWCCVASFLPVCLCACFVASSLLFSPLPVFTASVLASQTHIAHLKVSAFLLE